MNKTIFVCCAVFLAAATACKAEQIVLNSGKVIEGAVLETTPEYLKIDSPSGQVYFQWEYIKSVDGVTPPYGHRARKDEARVASGDAADDVPGLRAELAQTQQQLEAAEKNLAELKCVYEVSLANACMKAGWVDQAFDAYSGALNYDPTIPEAQYNIALIYEHHKNDPHAAIEHYRKYLELKPGAEDRDQVEETIASLEKSS